MKEETRILHEIPVDELTGAISVPIYQTSTFVQEAPGVNKGFDYSRSNNPTRATLEKTIASLENGSQGFAFSSGLAAVDAVIKLLKAGDEIVAVDDIYGGTFRAFEHIYSKFGISVKYVDTTDVTNVIDAISRKTKMIWLESPTNPTLKISDLSSIAEIGKDLLLVVDNTFASPVLQKPLDLGADIVIHSGTKYLAGHSDVIAGLVVVGNEELAEQIKFNQNASGAVLGPFDSWLTLRGITTLQLRIEKQCQNAQHVAEFLSTCSVVDEVFYPGLVAHHNHDVAKQQQLGFGGIVSFSLKDDSIEAATKFATSTKLFKLAESLGGVKSLLCHPASMTHKSTPEEIRHKTGIKDSLIRLSCGIENCDDLLDDVNQALAAITYGEVVV